MKILFISDTHCRHSELKLNPADMIIHCGDFSNSRFINKNYKESEDFLRWFDYLDYKHKVLCLGNHDIFFSKNEDSCKNVCKEMGIDLLIHDIINIGGIDIFCSPYTPSFGEGWAYNVKRGKIDKKWAQVPSHTDILVTHGPSNGTLDLTENSDGSLEQTGCKALSRELERINPKIHAFGHIHNFKTHIKNFGVFENNTGIKFINASSVNDKQSYYPELNNGVYIDYFQAD